jgi:hypothetical protein
MTIFRRRDLFGLALTGAGAAVANAVAAEPAAAPPIDTKYKRRSRYQPDSAEVRKLSRPVEPFWSGRPIISGAIRSHVASLKTKRSFTPKTASQKKP